jgi:hypothetical protein
VADFKVEGEALQAELTYQLRDRRLKDRDNQRWLNEIGLRYTVLQTEDRTVLIPNGTCLRIP